MKDNKGTTVLLTVIGIATLLVAVVGATFAYFTATVTDENEGQTDVTVQAATVGTITFTHGTKIELENAYPGDSKTLTFTVASDAASTTPVAYDVYLTVSENTFTTSNLRYQLSATSETGTSTGAVASTGLPTLVADQYTAINNTTYAKEAKVKIGTATLGTGGTVDTWTLTVELQETGAAQNDDQGKAFSGTLSVEATTKYSTGGNAYVAS